MTQPPPPMPQGSPPVQRSRRSVFWLPTVIAVIYGLAVLTFAAVGTAFTDEGGSWSEVPMVVAGNFALVWVVVLVASTAFRRFRKD